MIEKYKALEADLETERLRLAACGVAALGYFDGCKDEYRSASLEDTLRLYESNKELVKQLAEYKADAERYRWLRDNNRGMFRVEEQRRGFRSTAPGAIKEMWFEHTGWCVEGCEEKPTMDEAIDAAMKGVTE